MGLFDRRRENSAETRIFFATDIHGSELCFRKFLNAGEFYQAPYLILGGDMTGKLLVPIVEGPTGLYSAEYGDSSYEDLDSNGLRELTSTIRRFGHYYIVGTADELSELDDPERSEAVFRKVVYESITDWMTVADDRLRGSGRRCFMAPGNDDFLEIDAALCGSEVVEFAEGRCLQLGDGYEMMTTGFSNPTPWDTERELAEPALGERLERIADDVTDFERLIAVIHAPPYDAPPIDVAPKLDSELRMSVDSSGVTMAPVGSTAVREFIEAHQPLLGLHGHVHEGGGAASIGRTTCINPGSEYTEGILAGVVVNIRSDGGVRYQFVSG